MKQRKQAGSIWPVGDKWYVRYAERRVVDGVVKRQRVLKFLAEKTTRGKTPPLNIVDEAKKVVDAAVNNCEVPTGQLVSLADFVERGAEDTYAYSLEEIGTILSLLPEPAATIFS